MTTATLDRLLDALTDVDLVARVIDVPDDPFAQDLLITACHVHAAAILALAQRAVAGRRELMERWRGFDYEGWRAAFVPDREPPKPPPPPPPDDDPPPPPPQPGEGE